MEQVEKILALAASLPTTDKHELLRQLHDSIYNPQYGKAPAARPHVGV